MDNEDVFLNVSRDPVTHVVICAMIGEPAKISAMLVGSAQRDDTILAVILSTAMFLIKERKMTSQQAMDFCKEHLK